MRLSAVPWAVCHMHVPIPDLVGYRHNIIRQ